MSLGEIFWGSFINDILFFFSYAHFMQFSELHMNFLFFFHIIQLKKTGGTSSLKHHPPPPFGLSDVTCLTYICILKTQFHYSQHLQLDIAVVYIIFWKHSSGVICIQISKCELLHSSQPFLIW